MAPVAAEDHRLLDRILEDALFSVLETAGALLQEPDEGAERSKPSTVV